MKTMQPLISTHDGVGDVRTFQAYYCPACDEVRWCEPGRPMCFANAEHEDANLAPVWVER